MVVVIGVVEAAVAVAVAVVSALVKVKYNIVLYVKTTAAVTLAAALITSAVVVPKAAAIALAASVGSSQDMKTFCERGKNFSSVVFTRTLHKRHISNLTPTPLLLLDAPPRSAASPFY